MTDQTGNPPAGWYQDPGDPGQQRWWDGYQWSSSVRPLHDVPAPTMPPPATGGPADPFTPHPVESAPTLPVGPGGPTGQAVGHPPGMVPGTDPAAMGGMPVDPGVGPGGRSNQRPLLILVGVGLVVLIGAVAAVALLRSSDDGDDSVVVQQAVDADDQQQGAVGSGGSNPSTPDEPEPAPDPDPEPDADPTPSDEAGPGDTGTREAPLPYDQPHELVWSAFDEADGSRWTVTIGPPRDVTDAVLAENQFNDEPPDGVRFVGFDAELTLIEGSAEPLSPGFAGTWELLGGATARVYDASTVETDSFGCGVVPNQFDDFAEVFAGGTITGTICIPLPADDLDHPDTRVALHFFGNDSRAIFGP